MYRLMQIEKKDGFSLDILDILKQYKNIKVKKISDTLLELKGQIFDEEIICEIKKANCNISFDNIIYEVNDVDLFDFYYCSGQENPDKSIIPCNLVEKNISDFFDLSFYCSTCKLGLIQVKPLSFKGDINKVCKKKFLTPYWAYWLISKDLKDKFESAKLTGLNYLSVYDSNNKIYNSVFQIKPSVVLSNSIISECLIPRVKYVKCNCNNQTYVFKNLNDIRMKKEVKNNLNDFTELSERTESRKGLYILSKKFIHELIENGLFPNKHYQIWPIAFV